MRKRRLALASYEGLNEDPVQTGCDLLQGKKSTTQTIAMPM